jgi:hypothetical protein
MRVKSLIRISIKVKIQELSRLTMEGRAVNPQNGVVEAQKWRPGGSEGK